MRFILLVLFGVGGILVGIPQISLAQTADTVRVEVQTPSRPLRGIDRVRNRLHGQRQTPSQTVVVVVPAAPGVAPAPAPEVPRERAAAPAPPQPALATAPRADTSLIPPLPPLTTLTPAERARLDAISPGLASQLQQQVNVVASPTAAQDRIIVVNVPYVPPPVVPETLVVERVMEVLPDSSAAAQVEMRAGERRPLVPPFEMPRGSLVVERVVERPTVETRLVQIPRVYFEHNSNTPLAGTEQLLEPVGHMLAQSPDLRLEVVGHTDATGSEDVNLRISLERAETVRQYLINRFGVLPEQLTARGVGSAEPLVSNQTANARALNRRVELRVLSSVPAPAHE